MDYKVKKISLAQHLVIISLAATFIWGALRNYRLSEEITVELQKTQLPVINSLEPITPIPFELELDDRKVRLGEKLYHDKRLSRDNSISCASCHDLKKGGTDQVKYSTGVEGQLGGINSPTTFNSGFNFSQHWDGRVATLAEQAVSPVHNPVEMDTNWEEVIPKLKKDSYYRKAFEQIYDNGFTGDNIVDAIGVYEQSLITPNSRFDQYLRGNNQALTSEEKEGYRLFKEFGCISCHQGILLGGNMYQTIGVMEDYFVHRSITKADLGRYNVTGREWNRFQFKVPTLRNIEITFPYLHDGSAQTLEDVLIIMWNSQLGRQMEAEESKLIIQFLKTLTGEYKGIKL